MDSKVQHTKTKGVEMSISKRKFKHGENVAVIIFKSHKSVVLRGYIISTPHSHMGVNNIDKVVVYFYEPISPLADSYDDKHEQSYETNDPFLLTEKELSAILADRDIVSERFKKASEEVFFAILEALTDYENSLPKNKFLKC